MFQIFAFFRKNSIEILFVILQILAFAILVQSKSFHQARFSAVTAKWSYSLHEKREKWSSYFQLAHQNRQLQNENARLRSVLLNNYSSDVATYSQVANDSLRVQYRMFPARAVQRTYRKSNNYLVIDKGLRHGVYSGMGVISTEGVVGVVKDVGENYATVITLLHSKFRLSTRLERNTFFGTMLWDGRDFRYGAISDFPSHADIQIGDTVVTDTRSAIFPAGIPVGVINSHQINSAIDNIEAEVSLFTDFSALYHVYLVEEVEYEERRLIEELIEDER
jgi:rod shape-determining protein MreC